MGRSAVIALLLVVAAGQAQGPLPTLPDRRAAILAGNQIRTIIWDHGSIGQPGREPSLEWPVFSGLSYAYEFGPLIGVEVPVRADGSFLPYFDASGNAIAHDSTNPDWAATYHIISDGLSDGGGGDSSVEKDPVSGLRWQFEPLPGYANPAQSSLAVSDDSSTWPSDWPAWPGTYQVGAATADQAAYFVMDDRHNLEFSSDRVPPYYPFPGDTTIGGLGLRVEVRAYQWSNILANDAIFFFYAITNTTANDYEKVVFGMFGDPHIGGPADANDDWARFDRQIDMVYAFDGNNTSQWGGPTGWLGYMFLESPGNATDLIDNDGDGMVDESMDDGLDNDGDWNPASDDVGIDGIGPGTPLIYPGPDEGEGDGLPTAGDPYNPLAPGEPNFEGTDLDEADMIGLTSFNAINRGAVAINNDADIWQRLRPLGVVDSAQAFSDINQNSDTVFLFGSGYFPLQAGETRRFSIAILLGENEQDLLGTARIVQNIYNSGYRFTRAPDLPALSAAPGDGRVTLYWDDWAEDSWDPAFGYDFEGYSIYRATDPGFEEIHTITDNAGNAALWKPLARFDLVDGIKGPAPAGIRGLHFDLGSDSGLRHEYVDSTVTNGVRYFYAVVPYDFGDTTGLTGIPPTEATKRVREVGLTGILQPDPNVAIVVPRGPAPGSVMPQLLALEHSGPATGSIVARILDPPLVRDSVSYSITFGAPLSGAGDTLLTVTDQTAYSAGHRVIGESWFRVSDRHLHVALQQVLRLTGNGPAGTAVPDSLFSLNATTGTIRFSATLDGDSVVISYLHVPLWQSRYTNAEDANAPFDGIRLVVADRPLGVSDETGWLTGSANYTGIVSLWDAGSSASGFPYPHSYELHWQSEPVASGVDPNQRAPFVLYDVTDPAAVTVAPYLLIATVNNQFVLGQTRIGILSAPFVGPEYKTWELEFVAPASANPVAPRPDDIFQIKIDRPFSSADEFLLTTAAGRYAPQTLTDALAGIAVVPNPYLARSAYELPSGFAGGRGDREVQFINLPPSCVIRIYTIAGDLVRVIQHNTDFWNGRESYDLLNREQMEIAFGIYIWHVDARASGLGQKIGKFAVIK